ncbi:MAG: hypothetical protein CO158_05405 [Piscirickettsiaceae bacterium CG_4_9_14_3_um_filter_43_564]|nr:hypothetical protein [Thiomicrospira sp.]OIP95196.1 MAG: hypothetical protein AUK56_06425 [Thiomicrospira sp. CG2_30_44_34]PIQ02625.1 MAG: hypothetical protein COW74_10635 [Piscirickettsiaceae bacterium CG18_big_fil_WC_8_21_14_2_50_44_103]PIU39595.1 MAG: hypothetical protein COT01_00560 [Piscirickettsiaceae bacterium CG07_land_8_20_14_0_80_44_28]PIW57553.1 MAG: hypothetical protein COW14_05420 [Piscirickettsiaceae bacterium CG12_big_fil_rev_8_21_14_0_65_44_934]PIW76888.1 MAG: hypothetical p
MKLGIKKNHENEWLVHIGFVTVKLDRFSVELLNITLEHLIALDHGETHSILQSYIAMGLKIKELDATGVQLLVLESDNQDLLRLMQVANDKALNDILIKNAGGILARQLKSDFEKSAMPDTEVAKEAIKRIVETLFNLEAQGKIEFYDENKRYI